AAVINLRAMNAFQANRTLSVAEWRERRLTPGEKPLADNTLQVHGRTIGEAGSVARGLMEFCRQLQIDEIMLVPMDYDAAGRLRTVTSFLAVAQQEAHPSKGSGWGAKMSSKF